MNERCHHGYAYWSTGAAPPLVLVLVLLVVIVLMLRITLRICPSPMAQKKIRTSFKQSNGMGRYSIHSLHYRNGGTETIVGMIESSSSSSPPSPPPSSPSSSSSPPPSRHNLGYRRCILPPRHRNSNTICKAWTGAICRCYWKSTISYSSVVGSVGHEIWNIEELCLLFVVCVVFLVLECAHVEEERCTRGSKYGGKLAVLGDALSPDPCCVLA